MRVDRLSLGDVAVYRDFMLEAYALHPESFTSTPSERRALPLAWWERRMTGERDAPHVIFAVRDDALHGVTGLAFNSGGKTSHKARLFGMYVAEGRRRAGVADTLVTAALDEARARVGVRLVQLTVSESNRPALALYRKRGFREYGLEPFAIAVDDRYVGKVHMWLPLQEG